MRNFLAISSFLFSFVCFAQNNLIVDNDSSTDIRVNFKDCQGQITSVDVNAFTSETVSLPSTIESILFVEYGKGFPNMTTIYYPYPLNGNHGCSITSCDTSTNEPYNLTLASGLNIGWDCLLLHVF